MKQEDIIQLESIGKLYGKDHTAVHALRDISLTVPRGAFWSIMGPSGSGKSTLLHLLGLLDRPTSGQLTIDTETISAATDLSSLARLRRQLIGFIFQQFFLLPRLNAVENVILPALYAGINPQHARARAIELLDQVDMADRADHRPAQLSGGEQQRVAIARALVNDPAILLADEPTGNLDSTNGAAIIKILHGLHRDGRTILMVTHDGNIGKEAEKVVKLQDGRLQ